MENAISSNLLSCVKIGCKLTNLEPSVLQMFQVSFNSLLWSSSLIIDMFIESQLMWCPFYFWFSFERSLFPLHGGMEIVVLWDCCKETIKNFVTLLSRTNQLLQTFALHFFPWCTRKASLYGFFQRGGSPTSA